MRYRSSLLVRARFKVSGSLEPIPVQTEGVQTRQVVTVSRIVAPQEVTGCRVRAWQGQAIDRLMQDASVGLCRIVGIRALSCSTIQRSDHYWSVDSGRPLRPLPGVRNQDFGRCRDNARDSRHIRVVTRQTLFFPFVSLTVSIKLSRPRLFFPVWR